MLTNRSFLSEPNSSVSIKRRKINSNITEFFDKKDLDDKLLKESANIENEIKLNTLAMEVSDFNINNKNKKRKQFLANEEFKNNKITELINESLIYIVYKSLNLDEDFKKHNLNYIKETVKTFMKKLEENNCFCCPQYSCIDDIRRKITMIVNENKDNISTMDEKILIKQIKEACNFEFETSINIIKDKVLDTVNREKQYSEYLEKCKNEDISNKDIRNNSNTLFRNIFEGNISAIVKQEGDNSKLTKQNIMDIALSEAILDYTLLETVNTLRINNIDISCLKKLDYYFK